MKPEINPGDIVTLKSGGPKMTVEAVMANRATCTFYNMSTNQFGILYVQACALVVVSGDAG